MYRINTWISSTRLYNREHAQIIKDGCVIGEGVYKWQNRPWQKFTFKNAIHNAIKDAMMDLEPIMNCSSVDEIMTILNKED